MTELQLKKAQGNRKKAALACSKALKEASSRLNDFLLACNACQDASASRGFDDSRHILMRNINEFSGHLESVYDK